MITAETMAFPDNQDLCFDKADFEKDDFTVDNFLDNRGTNFEILRDDLGRYLKDLRSAMIELINQDYSDFVNLSSNLIGLDKSILKLKIPLGQFKEEILQVSCSLDEVIGELDQQLRAKEDLTKSKESLKNLQTLLSLMNKMEVLLQLKEDANFARVAAQLSQAEVCKSNCNMLSKELEKKLRRLEVDFFALMDEFLLQLLLNKSVGNGKELRAATRDCLKIYGNLGRQQHVEELVRSHIMRPMLQPLANEQAARSVVDLYSKLLLILSDNSSALNLLIQITKEGGEVKNFDFMMRSYWPEVAESLLGINSLFSPGHPNEFNMKYTETMKFLGKVEKQLETHDQIVLFRARDDYLKFTKKWNLIVYYQIRFQEIGGALEKTLYESRQFDSAEAGSPFELNVVKSMWNCVNQCFSPGIFLPQLLHKFWKLALQLLARTFTWAKEAIVKNKNCHFLSVCYADLKQLGSKIPDILALLETAHPVTPEIMELLRENLRECQDNFALVRKSIVDKIVEISYTKEDISKSVTDIPRIYRRTNRGVPTNAGPYMDKFLKSVLDIYSSPTFHTKFEDSERRAIILRMIKNVSHVYLMAVQELLTSVQKTEDSLRKLKQIRDKSSMSGQSATAGNQSVSDDDKIRLQIQQDLKHFANEVKKLGIRVEEISDIEALHIVVEKSLCMK